MSAWYASCYGEVEGFYKALFGIFDNMYFTCNTQVSWFPTCIKAISENEERCMLYKKKKFPDNLIWITFFQKLM